MERRYVDKAKPMVAVFGATGYTGRFVVAELLRRGITPVAVARRAEALLTANFPQSGVLCRQASVENGTAIDEAFQGTQAVLNCAGPFADTAGVIADAALRAEIHYLDVCAEQG